MNFNVQIHLINHSKKVANKASKSEELDLELDELFKELGFDNLDLNFEVDTNGTNDIGNNDTNRMYDLIKGKITFMTIILDFFTLNFQLHFMT